MNQELQATLDRLRAIAKANPRPDTRPECPAVDGEVPPDRLVERVLMKEGRPSVNLLPNCKGPCVEGDSGLHFEITETKAAKLCACGRANQRLLSLRAMKLPPEAIEKNHKENLATTASSFESCENQNIFGYSLRQIRRWKNTRLNLW